MMRNSGANRLYSKQEIIQYRSKFLKSVILPSGKDLKTKKAEKTEMIEND
jgi:hypothetical protein